MEDLLGSAFVKSVFAIFKGRPNQAYIIVVTLTTLGLGYWVMTADNPDDRTYGIIAICFVFLVTLSRIVRILSQGKLLSISEDVEAVDEEEYPASPETSDILPQALAQDMPPSSASMQPAMASPTLQPVKSDKVIISFSGMNTVDNLESIWIGGLFFIVGYLVAYSVRISAFISKAEPTTSGLYADSVQQVLGMLANPLFQFIFVLPVAVTAFLPVSVILLVLLSLRMKHKPVLVKSLMAGSSLLLAVLGFTTFQYLLLIFFTPVILHLRT